MSMPRVGAEEIPQERARWLPVLQRGLHRGEQWANIRDCDSGRQREIQSGIIETRNALLNPRCLLPPANSLCLRESEYKNIASL